MSERLDTVFRVIVALAAAVCALLVAALGSLGVSGLAALAATVLGAATACVVFFSALGNLPLGAVILATLAISSLFACARFLIATGRQQRLLNRLPLRVLAEGPLSMAAAEAGIAVSVCPSERPAAFCCGLRRPRVVVTDGLVAALGEPEQLAVFWHEAAHATLRAPLRSLFVRLTSATFFWAPMLRDLRDRFLLLLELDADSVATARAGRRAMAGALAALADAPVPQGAASFADAATARVTRLLDPQASLPPLWRPMRMGISAATLASLVGTLVVPIELDLREGSRLHMMLTEFTPHGVAGMALGLLLNVAAATALYLLAPAAVRRLPRRKLTG